LISALDSAIVRFSPDRAKSGAQHQRATDILTLPFRLPIDGYGALLYLSMEDLSHARSPDFHPA
jgi:hypothetical protein